MEDLAAYEAEVHELCGLHDSIARTDPNLRLEPDRCPSCAGIAVALRVQAERDEATSPPHDAPASAPRPEDGRLYSIKIVSDAQIAAEAAEAKKRRKR